MVRSLTLTFSKAIEVNPKDAEAYYFRGFANYDRHAFKEAGDDFKKAYELNRLSEIRTDTLSPIGVLKLSFPMNGTVLNVSW